MWQKHMLYVGIVILLTVSSIVPKTIPSEKFVESGTGVEFENIHDGEINDNINDLFNLVESNLSNLQNEVNDHLEELVKEQFLRLEKKVVKKMRYLERKVADIKNKIPEQLDDTIIQHLNEISVREENLQIEFEDIYTKLQSLENVTLDNVVKLSLVENSATNTTVTLDSLTASLTLHQTLGSDNNDIDTLANINKTAKEIAETLNQVLNMSSYPNSVTLQTNNNVKVNSLLPDTLIETNQNLVDINKSEIVSTSTEMLLKESQETGWDLSRCQEETVPNTRRIEYEQFHSLLGEGGGGEGGGTRLRGSFRGDGSLMIVLSRDPRFNRRLGLYFVIDIYESTAYLHVGDAGQLTTLQSVYCDIAPSPSHDTLFTLTIAGGLLKMVFGNASTPLLFHADPRLRQMLYIAFDTYSKDPSSQGFAVYKYWC